MHRRDHWDILGRLLSLLSEHGRGAAEELALSRIAQRANLPYDRLVAYIDELRAGGLVSADEVPAVTERGRDVLRSWRQWSAVLERFGLE